MFSLPVPLSPLSSLSISLLHCLCPWGLTLVYTHCKVQIRSLFFSALSLLIKCSQISIPNLDAVPGRNPYFNYLDLGLLLQVHKLKFSKIKHTISKIITLPLCVSQSQYSSPWHNCPSWKPRNVLDSLHNSCHLQILAVKAADHLCSVSPLVCSPYCHMLSSCRALVLPGPG